MAPAQITRTLGLVDCFLSFFHVLLRKPQWGAHHTRMQNHNWVADRVGRLRSSSGPVVSRSGLTGPESPRRIRVTVESIPSVAYPCKRSSPMHNGVLLYP